MHNPLIAKQATLEDLEDLSILFNEYRIFYKQESDLEGAKRFLFERFEHRDAVIFIAKDNEMNKAIGFTQLYPSFSSVSMKRSWILNDLYVADTYRKRGAAQLLLEAAELFAKYTKAKGLGLSTAIDNEQAQRIYERNGYKKNTDFYHYYLTL
ncbi:GNAT family N-acetyltransferase [Paenibacillus agricola]|uniref:GNAT family N-acetyltransferase n=1 Tax=Paenibacillus agricola TaxID=2716264 RepID=A0ABX0JES6_9BACL|nr:GNAT family N-acetyltransferase [Paenibacillus agricola]NHN33387.1 GNAT family N-acetyltransferase [Paenibacillus agricola]